jgi:hypothetical protein
MLLIHKNENGMILVLVLSFLAIISLLGATAIIVTTTDIKIGGNYKASVQAFYDADAGVNYALSNIKNEMFALPDKIGASKGPKYTVPTDFSFSLSKISMVDKNIYSFISTGGASGNKESTIKVIFSKISIPIDVDSPMGIYGSDPEIEIKGNAKIDGRNHNVPANFNCSGSGCNGSLKGGNETPGIYTTNAADFDGVETEGKKQNVFGDPPVKVKGGNYTGQSWQDLANALIPMADITFNKGDEITGKQELGTRDSPKITVIDGKAKLSGEINGSGILIVTDAVEVKGNLHFEGLIIIKNDDGADPEVELDIKKGGKTRLFGTIVVAGNSDSEIEIGGDTQILYSSQALKNVKDKLNTTRILSWQTTQ